MLSSPTKKCPRCNSDFTCNPANIAACQCNGISFSEAEKAFITQQAFMDCLCIACLKDLKQLAQHHSDDYDSPIQSTL